MENERFKKRIRRVAGISFGILAVYLLLPLYLCGKDLYMGFLDGYHSAEGSGGGSSVWNIAVLLAAAVAMILVIVNSFRLLLGMRRGETPFQLDNGRRIRRMGVLLMLIEPLLLLESFLSDGSLPEIYGISFVAGLVMYNVSLLFDYGAHLQQESDETL